MSGSSGWRGVATVSSGTTVATVSAAAARSGAVIILTPYMYANAVNSGQHLFSPVVGSVSTGRFVIFGAGSIAPLADCPVAWQIIR